MTKRLTAEPRLPGNNREERAEQDALRRKINFNLCLASGGEHLDFKRSCFNNQTARAAQHWMPENTSKELNMIGERGL